MDRLTAGPTVLAVLVLGLTSCGRAVAPPPRDTPTSTQTTAQPGLAPSPDEVRRVAAGTAGELDPRVVPVRYDVSLTVDPASDLGYAGHVAIELDVAGGPVDTVALHACHDLDLLTVRVDGEDADVERTGAACRIAISPARALRDGTHHLDIDFAARWGFDQGIFRYEVDGVRYVASHMGEGYTREALPCFDEPAYKAPWSVTLTVPEGLVALANAAPLHDPVEADAPGFVVHRFATTPPMSSYLVALAVGPWDLHEVEPLRDDAPLMRIVVTRDRDGWQHAAERTPVVLDALERWTDSPLPYDKLDIIAVDGLGTLAMENPGLVTVKAPALLLDDDETRPEDRRYVTWILAHELAHMWFGDLVTMAWWDDLWLNESLATWLGARITELVDPGDYQEPLVDLRDRHAMFADDVWPVRTIRAPVEPVGAEIEAAFALQTYFKGAAVLSTLQAWVGAEPLRDALRGYLRTNPWRSVTRADFMTAMREHLPADVERVLDGYLEQPGVPRVDLAWSCSGAGQLALDASIERHVPRGATGLDTSGQWTVPVCMRLGTADGALERHCAVLDDGARVQLETASGQCPTWLHPSADEVGYYRWTLPEDALERLLTDGLAHLSDVESAGLIEQLWGALESGQIAPDAWLRHVHRLAGTGEVTPVQAIAVVERLEDLSAAGALEPGPMRARAGEVIDVLEAALGPAPTGYRADEVQTVLEDARLRVLGDDEVARAALEALRTFLDEGSTDDTDWSATTRALRRAARVADEAFTEQLAERYGPVCGDWFGSVFANLQGAAMTSAVDHLVAECAPIAEGFLVTLRHNPAGAATLYAHLTAGDAADFVTASLVAHAAASACIDPATVRTWLADQGLDPDDRRLARPLAEAARCVALSGR